MGAPADIRSRTRESAMRPGPSSPSAVAAVATTLTSAAGEANTRVASIAAAAAIDATLVFASPAALVNVVATAATADGLDGPGRIALSRVRLLMSAGAPIPPELLREMGALMPNAEPHTPYGMTEALPVADISLDGIDSAGTGEGVCV